MLCYKNGRMGTSSRLHFQNKNVVNSSSSEWECRGGEGQVSREARSLLAAYRGRHYRGPTLCATSRRRPHGGRH